MFLYDAQASGRELRVLKGQSENYGMLHTEMGDYTFAALNLGREDGAKHLRIALSAALQEALGLQPMSELIAFAKRKKFIVVDHGSPGEDLLAFKRLQFTLDRVQDIKDFLAVLDVLKRNQLEKNKKIYQGKSVFELVSQLYEALAVWSDAERNSVETKEVIAVLYQTKDINPPYFFSFSFSVGVYLPLLSPIVFPPILTLIQCIKAKLRGKAKVKLE